MNHPAKKDEYYINIINEQNVGQINESIENLLAQKNEYDSVVVSRLCQCSDTLKSITYSPESFIRELVEKTSKYFLTICCSCSRHSIFNISLRTLSYEPRTEYFINYENENVDRIISYLKHLSSDREYKVYGIWSCQSCDYSNNQENIFNIRRKDFERYLKGARELFWKKCLKCHNKCQVSSYHLLKRKSHKYEELCSITEIARHLIDNNEYQIYGYWLCRSWKCRHELPCKTNFDCRYKWQSRHRWKCQHEPKCEGLWSAFRCRIKECKCKIKHDWKYKYLLLNDQCEQQHHDAKCEYSWLSKNKWRCQHDQKCDTERECQREWLCLNDWKGEEYTQDLLKVYLKKRQSEQYEIFRKDCKECGEICQISSFHLDTSQSERSNNPSLAPTVEIICHLVWNNHYRVFGEWTCNHCFKEWSSSYTWIKLHKLIDKIPAENLNRANFYMQSCYDCNQPGNRLLKYEHLEEAVEINHHKRHLCKKCQYGEICHKTGDYLGVF